MLVTSFANTTRSFVVFGPQATKRFHRAGASTALANSDVEIQSLTPESVTVMGYRELRRVLEGAGAEYEGNTAELRARLLNLTGRNEGGPVDDRPLDHDADPTSTPGASQSSAFKFESQRSPVAGGDIAETVKAIEVAADEKKWKLAVRRMKQVSGVVPVFFQYVAFPSSSSMLLATNRSHPIPSLSSSPEPVSFPDPPSHPLHTCLCSSPWNAMAVWSASPSRRQGRWWRRWSRATCPCLSGS